MLLHRHNAYELIRVRSGALQVLLNGKNHLVSADGMLLIRSGAFHALLPTEDCTYDCIVFDAALLLPDGSRCHTHIAPLSQQTIALYAEILKADTTTQRICEQLFSLLFPEFNASATLEVQGLLLQLLGHMLRSGAYDRCPVPSAHAKKAADAIDSVLARIREQHTLPLSLTEMSDTASLSPNYFCRYFKKLAGCSPVDYLINYRILVSEALLRETNRPIADIATACGFNDASHYIKFFRRKKGITPRQYRSVHCTPVKTK